MKYTNLLSRKKQAVDLLWQQMMLPCWVWRKTKYIVRQTMEVHGNVYP
jgi:hypothetical protein